MVWIARDRRTFSSCDVFWSLTDLDTIAITIPKFEHNSE